MGKKYRNLRRYREIARILARHGLGFILRELGVQEFLHLPGHVMRQEPLPLKQLAQRLRRVLEDLGPTYVKLGQIASTRADILPKEIVAELEKLQDRVPPFSMAEVKHILERELGKPMQEVFASFGDTPLAAASIGQVHAARLRSGEKVAVKVQRPGARETVESDFSLLSELMHFVEQRSQWAAQYRLSDLFGEFAQSLRSELDYFREGRNAERIRNNFAQDETVYIPRVYWEYTTRSVLTMEFVEGIKLNQLQALEAHGHSRTALAERVTYAVMKQILLDGFFHADPHPGNLLVMKDGRLLFLDFGMVGQLSGPMKEAFSALLLGLFRQSTPAILRAIEQMSMVPDDVDRQALRAEVERLRDKYYEAALSEISLGEAVNDLLRVAFRFRMAIPKDLSLVARALITLEGVVESLDPSFSVMQAAKPFGYRLMWESLHPRTWGFKLWDELVETGSQLRTLPGLLRDVLNLSKKGQLRLSLHLSEISLLRRTAERIANRIAFSLVLLAFSILMAALVLASAIGGKDYFIWRFPIAEAGLTVAAVMFSTILWSIFRSGRF